ncbi:MAG: PH domain-containing protein [Candidatus Kerfeldbacteria bacterium]|nr:PH domain-containing protein [Candidatus Kerfeldbacteria bacterium]
MFTHLINKYIHIDEAVIQVIRPSLFSYRGKIFFCLLLLLGDCFFFYPLHTLGVWGDRIFLFLLLVALFCFARIVILWLLNVALLTNKRIIDMNQPRLFERHVSECPLAHIQEIRYNTQGLWRTLCAVGTVVIDAGSSRGRIELVDIPKPQAVKELIMNAQYQHTKTARRSQDTESATIDKGTAGVGNLFDEEGEEL